MMFRDERFLDLAATPFCVAEGAAIECSLKEHLDEVDCAGYAWSVGRTLIAWVGIS